MESFGSQPWTKRNPDRRIEARAKKRINFHQLFYRGYPNSNCKGLLKMRLKLGRRETAASPLLFMASYHHQSQLFEPLDLGVLWVMVSSTMKKQYREEKWPNLRHLWFSSSCGCPFLWSSSAWFGLGLGLLLASVLCVTVSFPLSSSFWEFCIFFSSSFFPDSLIFVQWWSWS